MKKEYKELRRELDKLGYRLVEVEEDGMSIDGEPRWRIERKEPIEESAVDVIRRNMKRLGEELDGVRAKVEDLQEDAHDAWCEADGDDERILADFEKQLEMVAASLSESVSDLTYGDDAMKAILSED